jgi:drug/metabolite transporter (DMT)-like permease
VAAALALFSSVLWGSADFVGGLISKRLPALTAVVASQAIALACLLLSTLWWGWPDAAAVWPWAPLAGLVGALSLVAFYSALARGTMGIVSPVAATGVVVPVLLGLLAGERPPPPVLLGIVAAICGVVLASGPELRSVEADRRRASALGLAVLAALGFGLTLWLLAKAAPGGLLATLLWQRAAGVAAGLLLLAMLRPRGRAGARDLPLLALIGLLDLAANAAYAAASTRGLLSVTALLGSLYPVMTAALARAVLGERLQPVQWVGVAVVLAGVALIAGFG